MLREPNTEYILSLSYGKDSIACLEAIKQLGYPLDRIVHAEVWATDTIPADLPPMIEFKAHADKIIKERYGYTVEHICAVREARNLPTTPNSANGLTKDETKTESMFSLTPSERGITADSKLMSCSQSQEKVTYENCSIIYPRDGRKLKRQRREIHSKFSNQFSDSQSQEELGATATSKLLPYGFPISIGRGNCCTQLKQWVF